MSIYLKIKESSLAAESRIIRAQELRLKKKLAKARARNALIKAGAPVSGAATIEGNIERGQTMLTGLRLHRVHTVRPEARASHLARGFLKGKPYRAMERACWTQPNWARVKDLAEKYRPGDQEPQIVLQRFAEWRDAAGDWVLPRTGPRPKRTRATTELVSERAS